MSRESYAATVMGWRIFLDALSQELAKAAVVERQVAQLEAMHARAQQLVNERANLRAAMLTATRELQSILRHGRVTASFLRKAVRVQVPRDSPELRRFGINTGGRPSRRKKDPAPQE